MNGWILIVLLPVVSLGCAREQPAIAPVIPLSPTTQVTTVGSNGSATLTPISLPTPQLERAGGLTQKDAGLLFNILGLQVQSLAPAAQSGSKYVVLKVSLRNPSDRPLDVGGFPETVWLQTASGSDVYYPEPYVPGGDNLWGVIDRLSKSRTKPLPPAQSVSGSLYFIVPFTEAQFDVVWQPVAQKQWLFGPLQAH
jgi:hypothetical protein